MKEYKILQAEYHPDLEEHVNNAIKEGWRPTGGVFIEVGHDFKYYFQAMVK